MILNETPARKMKRETVNIVDCPVFDGAGEKPGGKYYPDFPNQLPCITEVCESCQGSGQCFIWSDV